MGVSKSERLKSCESFFPLFYFRSVFGSEVKLIASVGILGVVRDFLPSPSPLHFISQIFNVAVDNLLVTFRGTFVTQWFDLRIKSNLKMSHMSVV